jgi:hypothetical protein
MGQCVKTAFDLHLQRRKARPAKPIEQETKYYKLKI